MILIIIYSKTFLSYNLNVKRLFFVLFLILPLFFSCKYFTKEYYVMIFVIEDSNIKFLHSPEPHLETYKDVEFQCEYSLTPENDSIKIGSVDVYSTNPEVIEILSVNEDKYLIKAKAIKEGRAKIRVITKEYHSSTSLYIDVK